MKRIYKIATASGLVAVPVGATIGVVYGTQDGKFNYNAKIAETFGEQFFDQFIKEGNSSFVAAHLLNPDGGDNLTTLVRLDKDMDSDHAHNLIDKGTRAKESLMSITVDVDSALRREKLEEQFLEANKKISNFIQSNVAVQDREKLGIYLGKDSRTRKIVASIYKIKGLNDADQAMVDKYIADFGDIATPTKFDPKDPNKFLQLFGSQCVLTPHQAHYYQYNFTENDSKWGTNDANWKANDTWGYNFHTPAAWQVAHPDKFQLYDGSSDKTAHSHSLIDKLADKDLAVTYEPVLDLKNHTLKVIYRAWKMNSSSSMRFLQGDQVYNPIGISTKIVNFDLNTLGTTTAIALDGHVNGESRTNRDVLKHFFNDVILRYTDNKVIKPGLELLGSAIPSLKTFAEDFLHVTNFLKQYNKKYTDIFNNDEFLTKLLDKISKNAMVNGEAVMDLMAKFESQAFNTDTTQNIWTDIAKLSRLYTDDGGQYRMYQLVSLMKTVYQDIEDEIKKRHPEAQYIQDNSLVDRLLGFLKQSRVVPADYSLANIIANPIPELVKILFKLSENGVSISYEAAREILPIIPFSAISNNVDGWARALNLLTTGDNLKNVLAFLGGDKTKVEHLINRLLDADTRWEAIGEILDNRNVTKPMVMSLFKVLRATGIVPKMLDFIMGDVPNKADIWVTLFRTGGAKKIFDFIQLTFKRGLNDLTQVHFPDAIKTLLERANTAKAVDKPTNLTALNEYIKRAYAFLDANTGKDEHNAATYKKYTGTEADALKYQKYVAFISSLVNATGIDKDYLAKNPNVEPVKPANPGREPEDKTSPEHAEWQKRKEAMAQYYVAYKEWSEKYNLYIDAPWLRVLKEDLITKVAALDPKTFASVMDENALNVLNPLTTVERSAVWDYYSKLTEKQKQKIKDQLSINDLTVPTGSPANTDPVEAWMKTPGTDDYARQLTLHNFLNMIGTIDNDLTINMADTVEAILGVIDFKSLNLSPTIVDMINQLKGFFQHLIPGWINSLWRENLASHSPISLFNFLENFGTLLFQNGGQLGQKLLGAIAVLVGTPGTLTSSGNDRPGLIDGGIGGGVFDEEAATNLYINGLLGLFFPSGFVTGNAQSPADQAITVPEMKELTVGLLRGFTTVDAAIAAIKGIYPGLSTKLAGVVDLEQSLRDVYTNGRFSGLVLDQIDVKVAVVLQKIMKTGLKSLSLGDYQNFVTGLSESLHGGFGTALAAFAPLLPAKVDAIIKSLKLLLPKGDTVASGKIATALFQVLHEPLMKATPESIDTFIDVLNSFGLLKKTIPHIGTPIHNALNNGLRDISAYEWEQILSGFGISNTIIEIIQKLTYGENFKADAVKAIAEQVSHKAKPTKEDLQTGAQPLESSMQSFEDLSIAYDIAKRNIDDAVLHSTTVTLKDINEKMAAFIKAYNAIVEYNRVVVSHNKAIPTSSAPVPTTTGSGSSGTHTVLSGASNPTGSGSGSSAS